MLRSAIYESLTQTCRFGFMEDILTWLQKKMSGLNHFIFRSFICNSPANESRFVVNLLFGTLFSTPFTLMHNDRAASRM